ncbi:glycosyltransferase family 4 protein [Sulfurimonas hydrogeniphila]|uniref:glycosyltransferase family 4 protein n=1 Tax=Sulfurimonas TaxID=202746 RepID=UPI00125FD2E0|nr:glycosyltransferase family 1 protein [Sulfurimonas hydrogeniphila]
MRIVIDVQGIQSASKHRGIGRYSHLFVTNILQLFQEEKEADIWLVCNENLLTYEENFIEEFTHYIDKSRIVKFKTPVATNESNPENLHRTTRAKIIREYFLASLSPDLVLVTSLFEGYHDDAVVSINEYVGHIPTAVILYDLIPLVHQETYLKTAVQKDFYERKIASLKKADLYLSISEHSKQEAEKMLHIQVDKIVTIHTAIDSTFKPVEMLEEEEENFFTHYGLQKDFIFYAPGGFDARKNFKHLIEAYAALPQELRTKHQLVIASKLTKEAKANLSALAKENTLSATEFRLLGYVSDADLKTLYTLCKVFVFPSYHEGFGLPILEAISCGAAVICSNTTGIPEVINNKEALFDPSDVEAIKNKLQEALTSQAFLLDLKRSAVYQAKRFSPKTVAQKAKEALLALAKKTQTTNALHVNSENLLQRLQKFTLQCTQQERLQLAYAMSLNQRVHAKPQLLVDISKLAKVDAKSGIQRVVRSILATWMNMSQNCFEIQPIYFDKNCYRYANSFKTKYFDIMSKSSDTPIIVNTQDVYISLDLNADIIDETNIWHEYFKKIGMQLHFIVYDILPVTNPQWWPKGTSDVFANWLQTISKTATSLITISQTVEKELKNWLMEHTAQPYPKTAWFHLGADIDKSLPSKGLPDNAKETLQKLAKYPSFLMVGTIEPRKGHMQTIKAFEILWKAGEKLNLVIVGKKGWLVEELYTYMMAHPQKEKHLFILESISDEYLDEVYKTAIAVLMPSEAEGFGLPLIEAAQKNKPVIARDIPVFKEIAGNNISYFPNTKEPADIAKTLQDWIKYKQQMLNKNNIKFLTWKQSAQKLLELL